MNQKYDVFISYSRKDTKIADCICAALQNNGITYFIDRQDIGGGMEFPLILAQAIRNSQLFLFLASNNSFSSKFTINEITYAFNKKERNQILPYIIDGSSLPEDLEFIFAGINWRTLQQHSIDNTLISDIQLLLKNSKINSVIELKETTPQKATSLLNTNKNSNFIDSEGVKFKDFVVNLGSIQLKMIKIFGGKFELWSKGLVPVKVSDFWIGETTITIGFWKEIMGYDSSKNSEEDRLPKNFTNLKDCVDFINKLNWITEGVRPRGTKFRLPTEIEWEYAARGGQKQKPYMYSGSNDADEVAWFYKYEYLDAFNERKGVHPVGEKKPNSIGLYDMSGNIEELCIKYDQIEFFFNGGKNDCVSIPLEFILTLKGGSWGTVKHNCLIKHEGIEYSSFAHFDTGIRVVLSEMSSNAF